MEHTTSPVLHYAAEPVGLVQKCRNCGLVLADFANVMGIGNWSPLFWPVGIVTVWHGNPTQTAVGVWPGAVGCGSKPN